MSVPCYSYESVSTPHSELPDRLLLAIVAPDSVSLGTKPYALQVLAHSVGTWNAYEFLMLARSHGLPMPKHLFLSAMAPPDVPEDKRPWRRNSSLDGEAFKVLQGICSSRLLGGGRLSCMHRTSQ